MFNCNIKNIHIYRREHVHIVNTLYFFLNIFKNQVNYALDPTWILSQEFTFQNITKDQIGHVVHLSNNGNN